MRALIRSGSALMFASALYALAGCNAILGIEEGHLDEDTSSTEQPICNASQGVALAACMPTAQLQTDCENCITRECVAKAAPGATLDNAQYRIALAAYRSCQRAECTDSGNCAKCLSAEPSAACVAKCAPSCQGAEVLNWCDAYCRCMGANCKDAQPKYKFADGSAAPDCMTKCAAEDIWRVNCLMTHCEIAASQGTHHCYHADDSEPACERTPPSPTACTNRDQKQLGYPCKFSSDCCSGACSADTETCVGH